MFKKIILSVFAFLVIVPALTISNSSPAKAADLWGKINGVAANDAFQKNSTLSTTDPRIVIANVIKVVLSFLGIIAVVIVIMGGFKWMTSNGNAGKQDEAKKLIISGVVGMIIILAAFGIATFITTSITDITA